MSKDRSLQYQVIERFRSIYTPGVSRHEYQKENRCKYPGIAGNKTLKDYTKLGVQFAKWTNNNITPRCKDLNLAKQYAPSFMRDYAENHSARSCKTMQSALNKLYGTHASELTGMRFECHREDITNNRGELRTAWEKKHPDMAAFLKMTGVRRSEAISIRACDYRGSGLFALRENDKYVQTKGGRPRYVQVLPQHIERLEEIIRDKAAIAGKNRPLFSKKDLPDKAQSHQYRSIFATEYYNHIARDVKTLPYKERYHCRKDRYGDVYDKKAMAIVSEQLGHSRLSVIAESYLR